MRLATKIKIFFVGTLLANYLLKTPGLMDEYYAGRFALLSVLALWAIVAVFPAKKAVRVNILDLSFLLFYLISLLSLFWAHLPSIGFLTVQTVLLTLVCYAFFRFFSPKISNRFIFNLLAVLSVAVLLIASWQLLKIGLSDGLGGKNIYRVFAHSGHKNLLASFIFLLFGFTLLRSLEQADNPWNYLLLTWQILVMVLLRSRAVFIALLVLFLMLGLYFLWNTKNSQKLVLRRILPFLLLGLVLGGILFKVTGASQKDLKRLNPMEYLQSASAVERLFVWNKTRELIEDRWFQGYGAGNWKIFFPSKSISGSYRLQYKGLIFTRVHNDFLEVWAELGIFGFLFFSGIFGIAIRGIFYSFKASAPSVRRELFILAGILMGYIVISLLDFPKERFEHQVLFAFLLARIVEKSPSFFQNPRYSINLSRKQYIGLLSTLGILLLPNLFLSYERINGEKHSMKALIAQAEKKWPLAVSENQAAYSTSYQINPLGLAVKWQEGLSHYYQGKYTEAAAAFDLAVQQTPYQINLLNDYGSCLVQLKNYKKAVEVYLRLLYINPVFEEGMFNIAYAYAQLSNFEEAYKWVNKTENQPEKKAEFIQELDNMKREKAQ